jgi:gliding motility-associated-like protein
MPFLVTCKRFPNSLLFVILAIFLINIQLKGQTGTGCITSTFYMQLHAEAGKKIELKELQTCPDRDFVLFGNQVSASGSEGLIIRMSNSGSLLFQKQLRINNQPLTIFDAKVFLSGNMVVTGILRNSSNSVFLAHLKSDLTIDWVSVYTQPSTPMKATLALFDTTHIALAIQLNDGVVYQRISEDGTVKWVRKIVIAGLTELVGFSDMSWTPLGLVSNCARNGKRTFEVDEIDRNNGNLISAHTEDNGTDESKALQTTSFNQRINILGIVQKGSGGYEVIRNNTYTSSKSEVTHSYQLPGTFDFNVTAAMDNSGDAMGLALPQDGKLIFIRQFSYYQTAPEHLRQYNVPVGSSVAAIARSFDGGFLFGLNTASADSLVLIKTDSIGRLAGCSYSDVSNKFNEQINRSNYLSASTVASVALIVNKGASNYSNAACFSQFSCNQIYCPPTPVQDSCLSTYYKVLRSHSYIDLFADYNLMRNNKHVVSTYRYDRILGGSNQVMPGLKTFTEKGEFVKGVKVFLGALPASYILRKISDSTIMLISYSNPNSKPTYTFTLVSDDLTVLWSKTAQIGSGMSGDFQANDLCRDGEGNYYFVGASGGFMSNPSTVIFKMDAQGNPLWIKSYGFSTTTYFGTGAKVVATNTSLIIVIEGSPTSVSVRLDKNTGKLLNSYKYNNASAGSVYSRLLRYDQGRIFYAGNDANDDFVMAVFDTVARPTKIRTIKNSSLLRAGSVKNSNLYASYQYHNGVQWKNVLLKADSNLNIVYINEYDPILWGFPKGMEISNEGNIYMGGNYSYPNYLDPYISKYTNDGKMGTCSSILGNPTIINVDPQTIPVASSELNNSYNIMDIPVYFYPDEDGQQVSDILCSSAPQCHFIGVKGDDKVCSLNQNYTIKVSKDVGCTVAPQWTFDTVYAKIVITTDSLAVFQLKKEGTTWFKASLNSGCTTYADSLMVDIFNTPKTLNLGNDTALCPGNRILLNAHKGYQDYKWQDGSTDSTFTVDSPGVYFVSVQTGCGGVLTDTIIVSPNAPIPFNKLIDRVKCNNDTIQLQADTGFINYSWFPNYQISSAKSRTVVINPSIDTSYFLTAEKTPGCFIYDTVRVIVHNSPSINLGRDTSFCEGNLITLNAGAGFKSYLWNDGSKGEQLAANKAGNYSVTATTAEGCKSADSLRIINVFIKPVVNLNKETALCFGSSRILDAGVFARYKWQDNSLDRTFQVRGLGKYYVEVTDGNNCSASDTTSISTILPLPKNFLPADTAICSYGTLTITSLQTFNKYLWSTNAISTSITVSTKGIYWLEVSDQKNCVGRDSITVLPKDCMKGLYVPTAFTPNHDGKNDVFRAMLFGPYKSFAFTIYNRWGSVIFSTTDPAKGWDGSVNGIQIESGAFIWTCNYQLQGEESKTEKGTVTLIR